MQPRRLSAIMSVSETTKRFGRRPVRRAVAEDAALDLEPTKGVCAELKPAGDDAPRRAPRVLLGGDIG